MQSFPISLGLIGLLLIISGCGGDSPNRDNNTTNPLAILDTYPVNNTVEVSPLFIEINITFNHDIDAATLSASSFQLLDATNTSVTGNLNTEGDRLIFRVMDILPYNQSYTATISGVITAINGLSLDANISIDFNTQTQQPNTVFLTSVVGTGNLSTWTDAGGNSGLAAADAICQARATVAGLSGQFRAWLSDSTDDAYCRLHKLSGKKASNCGQASLPTNAGPWVRRDGFPFAPTIDRLTSNTIYSAVRFDEHGTATTHSFFTATDDTGTLHAGLITCSDWAAADAQYLILGGSDRTVGGWTNIGSGSYSSFYRLMCFQAGNGAALPNFVSTGKQIFATSTRGPGDLGSWTDAADLSNAELQGLVVR